MRLLPIVLAVTVAAGSSVVAAQGIGGLLNGTGLVDADFALMEEAAATLYRDQPGEVGSTAPWRNPDTGAQGTVELTSFDGRCAGLRHLLKPSAQAKTDDFSSRRCRNPAGDWALSLE